MSDDIFRQRQFARNVPHLQRAVMEACGNRNAMFYRNIRALQFATSNVTQPGNTFENRVRSGANVSIPSLD